MFLGAKKEKEKCSVVELLLKLSSLQAGFMQNGIFPKDLRVGGEKS